MYPRYRGQNEDCPAGGVVGFSPMCGQGTRMHIWQQGHEITDSQALVLLYTSLED